MKNVKSIITLVPCFGLHKDAVLTRDNNSDDFVYSTEYAGNDHRQSTYISLSETLIDKEHFSAIEWFDKKPLTNKEKIKMLTEERDELGEHLSKMQSILVEKDNELKYEKEVNKNRLNEIISLRKSIANRANRIDELLNRYNHNASTLDKGLNRFSWLAEDKDFVEAMTVYDNLIKAIEYIKGE